MACKTPGRRKLTCATVTCGKTFSTHSTNRVHCHTCRPKCREHHVFGKNFKPNPPVVAFEAGATAAPAQAI